MLTTPVSAILAVPKIVKVWHKSSRKWAIHKKASSGSQLYILVAIHHIKSYEEVSIHACQTSRPQLAETSWVCVIQHSSSVSLTAEAATIIRMMLNTEPTYSLPHISQCACITAQRAKLQTTNQHNRERNNETIARSRHSSIPERTDSTDCARKDLEFSENSRKFVHS